MTAAKVSAGRRLRTPPLSGRESSVLALLAQSIGMSAVQRRRILATLDGAALRIAEIIVGSAKHPTSADRSVAMVFVKWAESLPARCSKGIRPSTEAGASGR